MVTKHYFTAKYCKFWRLLPAKVLLSGVVLCLLYVEEFTEKMSKTSLVASSIKFVLCAPKGHIRKHAARILYHISESGTMSCERCYLPPVWIRDVIPKILKANFTKEEQQRFINEILTDPMDDREREMWDEMSKNCDLVLRKHCVN